MGASSLCLMLTIRIGTTATSTQSAEQFLGSAHIDYFLQWPPEPLHLSPMTMGFSLPRSAYIHHKDLYTNNKSSSQPSDEYLNAIDQDIIDGSNTSLPQQLLPQVSCAFHPRESSATTTRSGLYNGIQHFIRSGCVKCCPCSCGMRIMERSEESSEFLDFGGYGIRFHG